MCHPFKINQPFQLVRQSYRYNLIMIPEDNLACFILLLFLKVLIFRDIQNNILFTNITLRTKQSYFYYLEEIVKLIISYMTNPIPRYISSDQKCYSILYKLCSIYQRLLINNPYQEELFITTATDCEKEIITYEYRYFLILFSYQNSPI